MKAKQAKSPAGLVACGPEEEWWTKNQVRNFLQISTQTVDRNRVLWTKEKPPMGKWRFRLYRVGSTDMPRILAQDVRACGHETVEPE